MFIVDTKNILILIIGLLNVILGFVVYLKNRHNPSNFWFFMMCLFGGGWGVVKAFQLSVMNISWQESVFVKLIYIFGIIAAFSYLMLAYNFPYKSKVYSKKLLSLFYSVPLILVLGAITGLLQKETDLIVNIVNNVLYRQVNVFDFSIFAVYFFLYIIFGGSILLNKYRSADGIHKIQIKYLLWATLGTFITTGFVSVVLMLFNIFTYDWLGAVFLLIHFGVAGYLIFIKPKAIR